MSSRTKTSGTKNLNAATTRQFRLRGLPFRLQLLVNRVTTQSNEVAAKHVGDFGALAYSLLMSHSAMSGLALKDVAKCYKTSQKAVLAAVQQWPQFMALISNRPDRPLRLRFSKEGLSVAFRLRDEAWIPSAMRLLDDRDLDALDRISTKWLRARMRQVADVKGRPSR